MIFYRKKNVEESVQHTEFFYDLVVRDDTVEDFKDFVS